jgi:hypothetical protein
MRSVHMTIIACALAIPLPSLAQSGAANSDPAAKQGSEQAAPKQKGGLFGKVKGLAGNKVVKAVAKTAACTMVPGGQVIAGAIDAASSKSAGKAVGGAAGAAAGTSCMPGGLGAGGVAVAAAQAAAGRGAAGVSLGGLMPGMPLGGAGYGSVPGMPSPEKITRCLGLTSKEFQDLSDPTHGQPRPMTDDEMKRQAELGQKIDMQRYQVCMMQLMAADKAAGE